MPNKVALLTSFSTWKSGQKSNASDDLLLEIRSLSSLAMSLQIMRHLPVNVPVALELVVRKIEQLQPHVVLCCGMAEHRTYLNLETKATVGNKALYTNVNLLNLTLGLSQTKISEDAGRFVCNGLYYAILDYLQVYFPATQCLFVHVPPLTLQNREYIVADFDLILERLIIE